MSARRNASPVGMMSSTASLSDALRMVERQAVGAAAAAVVAGDEEALEAELAHDRDLVAGHRPLRVGRVIGRRRRLRALAVAAQVGGHHGEVLAPGAGRLVPHRRASAGGRAAAAAAAHCRRAAHGSRPRRCRRRKLEAFEHAAMNARNRLLPTGVR